MSAPPTQEEAVALLTGLVGVPSVSGSEGQAAEYLRAWMASRGLAARVDNAGNAVGIKGTGEREVLLLGHIDTVPGIIPVRREGPLLYGRGTVDAKGPLATFAAAAAAIDVPSGWRLTVVGAVEEEAATSRGARHIVAERSTVDRPVACLIGEPSGWDRLTIGYKGRLVAHVTLRLPWSHTAGRERLPAERGVDLWNAFETRCADVSARIGPRAFDAVQPSLRAFATDEDGTHAMVRLSIGVRVPPEQPPELVERDLVATIEDLAGRWLGRTVALTGPATDGDERTFRLDDRDASVSVACTVRAHEPAVVAGKSNALVRAFLGALRAHGATPRFVHKTGTSDMNIVGAAWRGLPVLAYGPGDSRLDHTPHEHIDLRDYARALSVLRASLERFMASPPHAGNVDLS